MNKRIQCKRTNIKCSNCGEKIMMEIIVINKINPFKIPNKDNHRIDEYNVV